MSKEKTIVTGDLVESTWVSNKPKPQRPQPLVLTAEEIREANLKKKKKAKK